MARSLPDVRDANLDRRKMLTAAAAAFGGVAIAVAASAKPTETAGNAEPPEPDPDAELIALAGRFMALQVDIDVINADLGRDHEEELDRLCSAQVPLLDEMADVRARTLEGQRQRARVLMAWYGWGRGFQGDDFEWERLQPLFSDLLGESV